MRSRPTTGRAELRSPSAGTGIDEFANEALERLRRERMRVYTEASGPLYFGRIDRVGRPAYIGRHVIVDEPNDLLEINWRAPAAEPFYAATTEDPRGITLRRRRDVEDAALLGFVDERPRRPRRGRPRRRDRRGHHAAARGEMRQIVSTITPDQYELDRARRRRPRSSSRAVPGPARPRSACTAPRGCCTPTRRSRAPASWSSAPTRSSSPTSRRCCRRWARRPSSSGRSTRWYRWETTGVRGRPHRRPQGQWPDGNRPATPAVGARAGAAGRELRGHRRALPGHDHRSRRSSRCRRRRGSPNGASRRRATRFRTRLAERSPPGPSSNPAARYSRRQRRS